MCLFVELRQRFDFLKMIKSLEWEKETWVIKLIVLRVFLCNVNHWDSTQLPFFHHSLAGNYQKRGQKILKSIPTPRSSLCKTLPLGSFVFFFVSFFFFFSFFCAQEVLSKMPKISVFLSKCATIMSSFYK